MLGFGRMERGTSLLLLQLFGKGEEVSIIGCMKTTKGLLVQALLLLLSSISMASALPLKGKTICVTGASSGIGAAIAKVRIEERKGNAQETSLAYTFFLSS